MTRLGGAFQGRVRQGSHGKPGLGPFVMAVPGRGGVAVVARLGGVVKSRRVQSRHREAGLGMAGLARK